MEIYGCSSCAELAFLQERGAEIEEDYQRVCPNCGGTLLTVQEAFDKILELKSEIRKLRLDEEWDDVDDN